VLNGLRGARIAVAGSPAWRDVELGVEVVRAMQRFEGWGSQTLVHRREKGVEHAFAQAWVLGGGAAVVGDPLAELAAPGLDYLVVFVHDRHDYAAQCALQAHRMFWPPVRPYWRDGQWPIVASPPRVSATPAAAVVAS
jgi:hypothetical protein